MVTISPEESIEVAYRRFVREMLSNGSFKELEKSRYHKGKGQIAREKRRQFLKTKRKRARARRSKSKASRPRVER